MFGGEPTKSFDVWSWDPHWPLASEGPYRDWRVVNREEWDQ
jgi:hypothetical protein